MLRIAFAGVSVFALVALAGCHPASSSATSADMPDKTESMSATSTGGTPAALQHVAALTKSGNYPKPPQDVLKKKLSPLEYQVTQNEATEPPFRNTYWDNHEPGIYVDVATGEPLFSSLDKFESGTGWPSFTQPIEDGHVVSKTDVTLGMARTEVRSASGDSHLGHVFDDGPPPGGMRYCINSASLKFVPVAKLDEAGYGAYRARFQGGVAGATPPPADSNNACAQPSPGEHAGCSTTLATAILGADQRAADVLASTDGVLQVDHGSARGANAVRVTFDPKVITFAHLLDAWAAAASRDGAAHHELIALTADQKKDADAWMKHATAPKGLVVESADETAFTATH